MHANLPLPEINTSYRQEAEREIRRFTRNWTQRDNRIAAINYFVTLATYVVSLGLAYFAWPSVWLMVPLIVINAFATVRLYVLQHDLGHNSFFSKSIINTWAGHAISAFTLTPFAVMQHNHNEHHSHLGNLDARATTEIFTMTLAEWQEAGWLRRLHYRVYRNPFLMVPVGGLFTYMLAYRWPKNTAKVAPFQVIAHNLALAAWIGLLWYIGGIPAVIIYVATVFVAGCIGVFLVYLQHNFEDTWWDRKPNLNPARAALQGASTLQLGWLIDLAVANITYHDIHHFNANIPSYRLKACHEALRKQYEVQTIGWPEAMRSFTLKLWDEEQGRLVRFPKPQQAPVPAVPAE